MCSGCVCFLLNAYLASDRHRTNAYTNRHTHGPANHQANFANKQVQFHTVCSMCGRANGYETRKQVRIERDIAKNKQNHNTIRC